METTLTTLLVCYFILVAYEVHKFDKAQRIIFKVTNNKLRLHLIAVILTLPKTRAWCRSKLILENQPIEPMKPKEAGTGKAFDAELWANWTEEVLKAIKFK
jgi:hypothetical protein